MSKIIVLNSSNWDPNSRKFVYKFSSAQDMINKKIGIQSLSLYNSFYNISAAYKNNQITINWLGTEYIHTFDDGYYSVSDINYSLQKMMIDNKIYLTSGENYAYYVELVINAIRYSAQLNMYAIPSTLSGFALPSGITWTLPSTPTTPTITFNDSFGSLIGLKGGTYPSNQTINTQTISTFSPEISKVNSFILTCNLVSNMGFNNPHDVIYSFPILNSYGLQMKINQQPVYCDVRNGHYQTVEIAILDQNLNILSPYDLDCNISLSLIDKNNI